MSSFKLVCHTTVLSFGEVAYKEGKEYEFDEYNGFCIGMDDLGMEQYFTIKPDHNGRSYKDWFKKPLEPSLKPFSQMNLKGLQFAKAELKSRLGDTLSPSRVVKLTDEGVAFEGGSFPATYDHKTKTLKIWGRGSRYAGASMTVEQLQRAEETVKEFFESHLGGNE